MKKLIIAAVIAASTLIGGAHTTQATSCTLNTTPYLEYQWTCVQTNGQQYRAMAVCNGTVTWKYGPWVYSGKSSVWCASGAKSINVGFRAGV